ncbi:MAG TPA: 6-phosphogluconolactonase [Nocardioidaceae bacterium]|nr:6-phosphogluconolactonase [Nocardioidaceae bacterium]
MTVEVLPSTDELARVVATRLVERLLEVQRDGRVPSVVLTGGSIAEAVHRAVLSVREHGSVDWSRVEVWYGDERFVPAGDGDRNALQARNALLSALPLDADRVHEMPASDGAHGDDADAAAASYGAEVLDVLGDDGRFDVLMLGVGPDGHCASLFPGHEAVRARGVAVAVHDSPKPPPTRISLCMDTLGRADEVWFIASGDGKAQAVHDALTSADVMAVPASGPKGRERTVWFLDTEAASRLPDSA